MYDVLFPAARAGLGAFLERLPAAELAELVRSLRAERVDEPNAPPWREADARDSARDQLLWLMDRDRKSTALKSVQGRIWQAGYLAGELRGAVYPDVLPAFERWKRAGRRLAIFSSGSVLAQQLLFGHSTAGDLRPWLEAWFDTTSGPKREAGSYRRIAEALALGPERVLFVSDVVAELDAARAAGCDTRLCVREAAELPGDTPPHAVIRSFESL